MAISEVDLILIDKQIKGTLTAKEHAMWSRRMQDRDFIRVWHAAHDDFPAWLWQDHLNGIYCQPVGAHFYENQLSFSGS